MIDNQLGAVPSWLQPLYSASLSRIIIIVLKTPGSISFILVQNGFCQPFFLRVAKMLSGRFHADAYLDHILFGTEGV